MDICVHMCTCRHTKNHHHKRCYCYYLVIIYNHNMEKKKGDQTGCHPTFQEGLKIIILSVNLKPSTQAGVNSFHHLFNQIVTQIILFHSLPFFFGYKYHTNHNENTVLQLTFVQGLPFVQLIRNFYIRVLLYDMTCKETSSILSTHNTCGSTPRDHVGVNIQNQKHVRTHFLIHSQQPPSFYAPQYLLQLYEANLTDDI